MNEKNEGVSKTNNQEKIINGPIDKILIIVVIGSILLVWTLLAINLKIQFKNYTSVINDLLKNPNAGIHSFLLTYSRALDFAIIKTSALFLGFFLILIGALYILRNVQSNYSLSAANKVYASISFQTSSPGLVIITLGIITVNLTLFTRSFIAVDAMNLLPYEQRIGSSKDVKQEKELKQVFFEPGKHILSEDQLAILDENIRILNEQNEKDVLVEGFIGGNDPEMSEEEKLALGEKRAYYVRKYIESKIKNSQRILQISYGKSPPLMLNTKDEKRGSVNFRLIKPENKK